LNGEIEVICDDENDYIEDYDEFKKLKNGTL